jgi:thymidylate synthase (FAD)
MNENKVELIGYYGSDLTHAQSAWTSTYRDIDEEKLKRVDKLLNMLAKDGHHTPFEKSSLHFLVTVDQATHIHILKHRVGVSVNGECLTGDNVITFTNLHSTTSKRLRKTVKELYDSWHSGRPHQNTEKDKLYCRKRIRNMNIRVLDETTGLFKTSHIKDIWYNGKQTVFEVTLENGSRIKCTGNHAIWTNEGYKTILTGLGIGSLVGCNGVKIEVEGRPWTYKSYYDDAHMYTRKEFSLLKNLKYELVKKWGYIFEINFKKNENKDFKKGAKPWNYGVTGYKIDIKNRKHNPLKGEASHFWRGGTATERELIGAWTTNTAAKVHAKYNYTCQNCGEHKSKLHAHHIIPVAIDITKAYNFDNLITVCEDCHKLIHKTPLTEQEFAEKVSSPMFETKSIEWGERKKRVGRKLRVHYSPIVSIECVGEEDTYDIQIDGVDNNFVANGIVVHNSARYKELKEDKFYMPDDWTCLDIENKEYDVWFQKLKQYTEEGNELYHQCLEDLTPVLGRKRAKESARFFKTMNSQITMDIMFNWRSFYHFQKLRNDEHSQKEVREVAQKMLELVKRIEGNPFEKTIKAFKL